MIHPVVMAGGKGERFWPYSNSKHPKQLLPLVTGESMLEDTLKNIRNFSKKAPIRLVVSKNLEKPVKSRVKGKGRILTLAEPQGRNTAAAIALAARLIQREDPKGVMLVLTADHAIRPAREFSRAMAAAVEIARKGDCLVTFGIQPTRPDVGYGYIESKGAPFDGFGKLTAGSAYGPRSAPTKGLRVLDVKGFHEKPSEEKAREYVKSGKYFWNSGMFAWRVDYLWEQFQKFLPQTAEAFEAAGDLDPRKSNFALKLKRIYAVIPDISIDYGILEKAEHIKMVIPEFQWDDIGAWSSLDRLHPADTKGNRAIGETLMLETEGTTCFSDEGLVCTFGVKDLLVVQHGGVTLVAHKSDTARLKELVKKVQGNPKWKKYL